MLSGKADSWGATDCGELLVQCPDRLSVAPGFEFESQPTHVLQVRDDLLTVRERQGVSADLAGIVDVALPDVGSRQRGQQPRPDLDHLRVERPERRFKHLPGVCRTA
jgi:hypothetical protein